MKPSTLLRRGVALVLVGAAACEAPTTPQSPLTPSAAAESKAASTTDEIVAVSPLLGQINARLASSKLHIGVDRAQLLYATKGLDGQKATLLLANDRTRGFGVEWVKGDPRRDGRWTDRPPPADWFPARTPRLRRTPVTRTAPTCAS